MSDSGVSLNSNGAYWQATYRDIAGRRVVKGLGPKATVSRREALRLCRELAVSMALRPGLRRGRECPTLGEWRTLYYTLRSPVADTTRELLDGTLALLCAEMGEGTRLDRVSPVDAARFGARISARERKGHAISQATVRKHIRHAKMLFGLAVRLNLIPANPFEAQESSVPDTDKTWATIDDKALAAMLDAAPDADWRCLIALCRLAGLRRGEALRLEWGDVDWANNVLTVEHEGVRTTKKRQRFVPIRPDLLPILREAFEQATDRSIKVCGGISTRGLTYKMHAIVRAAGVPRYNKPFHTLRKNVENEWLTRFPSFDVMAWIGHSEKVARKHYHRTTAAVQAAAMRDTQAEIAHLEGQLARLRESIATKLPQTETTDPQSGGAETTKTAIAS